MHPIIAKIQSQYLRKTPEIATGYTVRVSQKVTEGSKERVQHFEGLVIKVGHGAGVEKTFTLRKIVEGVGVEKTFPIHSPNLVALKVIKKAKVRREKLYYMRDRSGKSARLSETHVTEAERKAQEAEMEAAYAEAVKAQQKKQSEKNETLDQPVEETVPQSVDTTPVESPELPSESAESQEEKAA